MAVAYQKPKAVKYIIKPFAYPKLPKKADPFLLNRLDPLGAPDEGLTGEVQGMSASDVEERIARALYKFEMPFEFRNVYFGARYQSNTVELDFLVFRFGVLYPIQIDGEFAHASQQQKDEDQLKDGMLNAELIPKGAVPVRRIPGVDLKTQTDTESILRSFGF